MDKFVELVELASGEVVAIGPFHDKDKAQAFAEHIESYDSDVPVNGSRGGVRMITADALARELGISPSKVKPAA